MNARRAMPTRRRLLVGVVSLSTVSFAAVAFAAVSLSSLVWITNAPAEPPTPRTITSPSEALERLLSEFRKVPGISADFEEEKRIALLKTPLKSSGTVYFHPPHSLARVVKKPRASHLVVDGKRIVVKEEGVRKEVDLSDKPALRALVNSLLHVLSGEKKRLLADYNVDFEGRADGNWKLEMEPKNSDLKNLVTTFTFRGTGLTLSELRILEATGDETITKFSNVDTARKFTTKEISRIFDI